MTGCARGKRQVDCLCAQEQVRKTGGGWRAGGLGIRRAWGCRQSRKVDAKMAGEGKTGGGAGRREDARRYRLECKGKGV